MMPTKTIALLALALCATLPQSVSAVDPIDQPYVVYVSEDGSYARCGPSPEHYRTDKLTEGQELEVYLETDEGWLGIRPPESSFCWLPSDQVQLDGSGVDGKIIDPEAVAWIGTNLGRANKYRWQIQFEVGEPVAVIGATERKSASQESETWYRIVPPAGEFRWVHDSQIVANRQSLARARKDRVAEKIALEAERRRRQTVAESDPPSVLDPPPAPFDAKQALAKAEPIKAGPVGSAVEQVGYEAEIPARHFPNRPAQSRLSVREDVRLRDIGFDQRTSTSVQQDPVSSWVQADRPAPPRQRATASMIEASSTIPAGGLDQSTQQLRKLQVDFAQRMAAGSPARDVQPIKASAQLLIAQATDPVDRSRARLLVQRIEKYEVIAKQRSMVSPLNPSGQSRSTGGYDRRGWLVQVYSARPDAPPFALADRNGRTIAYVAPAMGMNIRQHLNQEVGIIGRPSYHTGIDSPMYIAEEVVRLKR